MPSADVILPLPVTGVYRYQLAGSYVYKPQIGVRVEVPFGKSQHYAGLVVALHEEHAPDGSKTVVEVLDAAPVLYPTQLAFYQWMASYYMATPGEVLKQALPSGLKLDSTRYLVPGPTFHEIGSLPAWAQELIAPLSHGASLPEETVAELLGVQQPAAKLRPLLESGWCSWITRAEERYRPKTLRCLKLSEALQEETALHTAFDALKRARLQEALLMLVAESHWAETQLSESEALQRIGATASVVESLLKKGFVRRISVQVDRLARREHAVQPKPAFTPAQEAVWDQMRTLLTHPRPLLLHGITGSGKTLLHLELAEAVLAEGKQVLYLVPEISLTEQTVRRLQARFGPLVGVYHSRYSEAERVEIWRSVLEGEYRIVLGARSALLLPFGQLGLIIVDEEHDRSLKQHDPAPRYQARDAAIWLADHLSIPIVLSSATPSLESFHAAEEKRIGYLQLTERPFAGPPAEVIRVDMRTEQANHTSHGPFSGLLLQELKATLQARRQAILFKNRRGFSPVMVCRTCGNVPHCPNCDIALTYHKAAHELRCHYCGHRDSQTRHCRNCGANTLHAEGMGTERIEELLVALMPGARIGRMDLDTTRGKQGFERLIGRFARQELDILVGTQMVTKGLDFPHVSLVGVLSADSLLHYPTFRATEQAYQLLVQFAGRAGRSGQPSRVLIQTYKPDHPFFDLLQAPYSTFADCELPLREALHYPPFSRLVQLELRHKDNNYLMQEALRLKALLAPWLGSSLLGPEAPPIARLKGYFRQQFLIKASARQHGRGLKHRLQQSLMAYYEQAPNRTLRIVVDVDPYS